MAQNKPYQHLFLETFIAPDVSAATYYLESQKEAVLIDPSLVVTHKIKQIIKTRQATLKYILVTHIPTSHILGYLEYQNVEVIVGPNVKLEQKVTHIKDKQTIKIGDLNIQYLNTRNYSQQAGCFVVRNEAHPEQKILFGGPDLIFGGGLIDQPNREDNVLEGKMELTLENLGLQSDIPVYPSYTSNGFHRFMTAQTKTHSLGDIINGPKVNYDLGPFHLSQWSKQVHKTNKTGPFNFDSNKQKVFKLLEIQQFDQFRPSSIVLDLRQQIPLLQKGTVIDSYIIPPSGNLGLFTHFLMKDNKPVLIIAKPEMRQQLINRLFNIGVVNILGFNKFQIEEWIAANKPHFLPKFTSIKDIKLCPQNILVDCRTPTEWKEEGIAEGARCIYFPFIEEDIEKNSEEYKKYDKIYVYCRMGYRARIGTSMFQSKGWKNCYIVPEPWTQIREVVNVVPYKQQ